MQEATEQVQQHARVVQRDAYDFARQGIGIPESMKGTEGEVIAEGILNECERQGEQNLKGDELKAFVFWTIELYATSIPRQLPGDNVGPGNDLPINPTG